MIYVSFLKARLIFVQRVFLNLNLSYSFRNEISAQLAMKLFQFSNDIENIFIQSNVVTVNFTKNMGTAVTDFEKLIEDFFLFYGDEEE